MRLNQNSQDSFDPVEDSIHTTAMIHAVFTHKKYIVLGTMLGAITVGVFAFMQPDYFSAQVKLMPPNSGGGGAQAAILGALGGGAGGAAANVLGLKNPSDLYVGVLKSRSIADSLIKQFNLQTVYEEDTKEGTRLKLASLTKIMSSKEGLITIDVEDKEPKQAAAMANAYFNTLQTTMQKMATTDAGNRRVFFENQLKQVKDKLTEAEESFKAMQQTTGVLQLDAQGKVAIESVAKITALISAKEVELASIQQYATIDNPDYQRRATELSALRQQLEKMQYKEPSGISKSQEGFNRQELSTSGLEYMRRLRELKYAETLFELIAKQFEFARLEEIRETPTLQLLDEAVVPENKSRPKRLLMIIGGTILGMFFSIFLILFKTRKTWFKTA